MKSAISPSAIHSLEEALSVIYWYKKDLRAFLSRCISDQTILAAIDWDNDYKRKIVSTVIEALYRDLDNHLGDLRRLFSEVSKMNDFRHLERLDDGKQKANMARSAVLSLRTIVKNHDAQEQKNAAIVERRRRAAEQRSQSAAFNSRLEQICKRYIDLVGEQASPQQRGYALERILYDLFELFDLDPKSPFRTDNEQIDGGFCIDNTDYILEAKWQKQATSRSDLDVFAAKIARKLDNTLGLFVSVNGFEKSGVQTRFGPRPNFILMTGADLMMVLEGKIKLDELLRRKHRYASQTGNILLTATDILEGEG